MADKHVRNDTKTMSKLPHLSSLAPVSTVGPSAERVHSLTTYGIMIVTRLLRRSAAIVPTFWDRKPTRR